MAFFFSACASQHTNAWEDIDYSSVYRRAEGREYDTNYKQPTIMSCIDEDLYNCQ